MKFYINVMPTGDISLFPSIYSTHIEDVRTSEVGYTVATFDTGFEIMSGTGDI
jgi:hypothetical protein